MAKNSPLRTGGPARVRLVVLEAEIPDGDVSSLAHALQNALRSPSPVVQRVPSFNGSKAIAHQPSGEDQVTDVDNDVEDADTELTDAATRPVKQRVARKPPKAPEIVEIEMHGDVSFASFAAGKKADSAHKKYLIAAAWLHEHRGTSAVTDGHIYTCFRSIGWPTNISDFAKPLRELKARKFFTTPERGHYAINHIGLDYVRKLGGGDGAS